MSHTEVEYKFSVSPQELNLISENLDLKSYQKTPVYKSDVYYRFSHTKASSYSDIPIDVRIRTTKLGDDKSKSYITYKERKLLGSQRSDLYQGEVNREYEIQVEENEFFNSLFKDLGAEEFVKKEKKGISYSIQLPFGDTYLELCAELIEVVGLGFFLETEVLLDKGEDTSNTSIVKKIENIQKLLISFASDLGVSKDKIEPRLYMDMLKDLSKHSGRKK